MMRPIVLGNGELHVNINRSGQVEDLHFPYVGLRNHTSGQGTQHHIGVWVDGSISWLNLNASDWEISMQYPYQALISRTKAINRRLGVMLEFNDTVDSDINALLRNIHVVNMHDRPRQIRLFMHQAFRVDDITTPADTLQVCKKEQALLHYRGDKAFVISGMAEYNTPFDQYSVGSFGSPGQEGTFRDAEDGELSMSVPETGKFDSTTRFMLNIPAQDSKHFQYWVAAGKTHAEAYSSHRLIKKQGVHSRIQKTLKWWHHWVKPASSVIDRIDKKYQDTFIKSLIFIKSHIDKRGAIVTSQGIKSSATVYCNPYEAASSIWPLVRLGYIEEPRRFFEFCSKSLLSDGSLPHLLQSDGAPGPNIFAHNNNMNADQTMSVAGASLVLFMFSQFHQAHPKINLLADFYDRLVQPLAKFIVSSIANSTSLPKPTYDIWGENHLASTHSAAICYAALQSASEMAEERQDADSAVAWRLAAVDIHTASRRLLYNPSEKLIYRGIKPNSDSLQKDSTLDTAAIFGSFMFGLFPSEGIELRSSIKRLAEQSCHTRSAPGTYNYYDNSVARRSPSVVASLWLAQYYIEKEDLNKAREIINWVVESASVTQMISSETTLAPGDNTQALSCWSHGELASTLLDMISQPHKGN